MPVGVEIPGGAPDGRAGGGHGRSRRGHILRVAGDQGVDVGAQILGVPSLEATAEPVEVRRRLG